MAAKTLSQRLRAHVVDVYDGKNDTMRQAADALDAAEWALNDAEETLRLVEQPDFRDPVHGDAVEELGDSIGYGALMSSASASWRAVLERRGDTAGGEFVAGPCRATVTSTLKQIRTALAAVRK